MVKHLLATALIAATASANADEWTGADKTKHVVAGAAVSSIVTSVTKNELHGFLAGVAVGVGKELYDAHGSGHPSMKDLAWTVAGSYMGAKLGGFFVAPAPKGFRLGLVRQF